MIYKAVAVLANRLVVAAVLLLGYSALSYSPLIYAAPVLKVDAKNSSVRVDRYIDVLFDETDSLELADLMLRKHNRNFAPLTLDRPEFGFTDATLWVRLSIRNISPDAERFSMQFMPISVSYLKVFDVPLNRNASQAVELYDFNDKREYSLRVISPGLIIHLGQFDPGQTRSIYLKVKSRHPLNLDSWVYSSESLGNEVTINNNFNTFLLGGLFAAVLGALVALVLVRERIFLYGALHALAVIGFLRSAWGYAAFLVVDEATHNGLATYLFGLLNVFFLLLMTQRITTETATGAKSSRLLFVFALANFLVAVLISFVLDEVVSFYLFYAAHTASVVLIVIVMLFAYSEAHKSYLLLLAICYALTLVTIFANTLTAMADLSAVAMGTRVIGSLAVLIVIFEMAALVLFYIEQRSNQYATRLRSKFNQELIENQTSLLSKLTHEIRTPMAGILGMSELLRSTAMSESQSEFADNIDRSSQELLHIIDDVTAFAHIQNGTLPIQKQTFNILEMLDELMLAFAPEAERKNIELVSFVEPGQPSFVDGDLVRTRHIVSNLISHCVAHLRDGEVVIRAVVHPRELRITVQDNGPGISSEGLAELFVEDDGLTHAIPTRGGIGLPLSKQIAEALGGRLDAESLLREGSKFELSLPVGDCPNPPANPADVERLRELRILVVDDSSTYCDVIERQVMHWGTYVESCMSGSEALALLRANENIKQPYDVLLVDYSMPGMNGMQLAERIKSDSLINDQNLLIVMLTGLNTMPDSQLARKLGIQRIVHKPLSSKALQKLLLDELGSTEAPVSPELRQEAAQEQLQSIKILLAEDNDISARVIERMLQRLGVSVQLVENGEDALRAIQRSHFDLVLMDCEMPVMDGFEATELVRRWEEESGRMRTTVIALTAHLLEQLEDRIKEAGMDHQVSKPLRINELEALLTRWIPAYRVVNGG
ncbi:MAG: response regulator [Pseudomonadales bacterium]